MKAHEFITEITKLRQSDYVGGSEDLYYEKPGDKRTPLPGGSGLEYVILAAEFGSFKILIIDPTQPRDPGPKPVKQSWDSASYHQSRLKKWEEVAQSKQPGRVIGKLMIERTSAPKALAAKAYHVLVITVHENYQGRGIAKALYGIALSIMRVVLMSGDSQTVGGRRNWVSLSQIPGVEVKGYIQIPLEYLKPNKYDDGNDRRFKENRYDAIMKLGGQYLGTTKDHEYWAFDVVPGPKGAELKPAVKNALSKHLYDGDDWSDMYAGLYAIWTGK